MLMFCDNSADCTGAVLLVDTVVNTSITTYVCCMLLPGAAELRNASLPAAGEFAGRFYQQTNLRVCVLVIYFHFGVCAAGHLVFRVFRLCWATRGLYARPPISSGVTVVDVF